MGLSIVLCTVFIDIVSQALSVGSNVWLSQWSSDGSIIVNGTTVIWKRNMYLSVYGALGVGQGELFMKAERTKIIYRHCFRCNDFPNNSYITTRNG